MTTIRLKRGDVNKLVVDSLTSGETLIQVFDGTGSDDNDLLIQAILSPKDKVKLIEALKKH